MLLGSPIASVGLGAALQQRPGRSVHCAYPLVWNTVTLERVTPNWLSWEEEYLLLKSKIRTKTTACKTVHLQLCSCQRSARFTLATRCPHVSVSSGAGWGDMERGDAPGLRNLSRGRALEPQSRTA